MNIYFAYSIHQCSVSCLYFCHYCTSYAYFLLQDFRSSWCYWKQNSLSQFLHNTSLAFAFCFWIDSPSFQFLITNSVQAHTLPDPIHKSTSDNSFFASAFDTKDTNNHTAVITQTITSHVIRCLLVIGINKE